MTRPVRLSASGVSTSSAATVAELGLPSRLALNLAVKGALAAAASVGLFVGGSSAARAGLQRQAKLAQERIGLAEAPPLRDGVYRVDGSYLPPARAARRKISALRMAMLGDSSSAGFGAGDEDSLPGVMLARALAAELGRPVQLFTHAMVGTGAADLARQCDEAVLEEPDLVVIIVGPNDVRNRVSPAVSVRELAEAVGSLRSKHIAVVVATCPDLGVIAPIPSPLRQLAGHWSRSLANRQEQAVAQAGGVAVPIGRLISPGFAGHPELFSADRFHPSGEGYALAVAVLVPAVFTAFGWARPDQVITRESIQPDAQRLG